MAVTYGYNQLYHNINDNYVQYRNDPNKLAGLKDQYGINDQDFFNATGVDWGDYAKNSGLGGSQPTSVGSNPVTGTGQQTQSQTPSIAPGIQSAQAATGATPTAAPAAAASNNMDPGLLKRIQDYYSGPLANVQVYSEGGKYYQENGNGGYLSYGKDASQAPGSSYSQFGPSGQTQADGQFIDPEAGEGAWKLAFAAAMAGGIGFDSGMFGSGAAGSGSTPNLFAQGFTDGGTAGGALDTAYAGSGAASSGAYTPFEEGFPSSPYTPEVPGTPPGGPIPPGPGSNTNPVFNPAQDSQIANENIANEGGNPLDGYRQPGSLNPGVPTSGPTSPNSPGSPVKDNTFSNGPGTGNPTTGAAPAVPKTGSGTSTSNSDITGLINSILGIGAGLYGANAQAKTAADQRAWLDKQMAGVDDMYKPGSPEYNYLMNEMERKDAAAGRNSQYGPRSVDLAARIAQIKGDQKVRLAGSLQNNQMSTYASSNTSLEPLIAALAKGSGAGGGGSIGDIVKNLSSLFN